MKRTFTNVRLILICALGLLTYQAQSQDTIIAAESTWTYLDDGSNQGTSWRDSGFVTTGWSSGQGPLGMGGISGATMNTTIVKNITTYFIKEVTLSAAAVDYTNASVNMMCDDAFVIYINGVEVARDNITTGAVTYTTTATTYISGSDEGDYDLYNVDSNYFREGVNIIAVELHNQSASSSDLAFDLELLAEDNSGFLLPKHGEWSYNDSGVDLGTSWYSTAYDASAWPTGDAVLGYGAITGASVSTTLSYGPSSSDKYPTTYFHKTLDLVNPNFAELDIKLLADDGAVVYINGKKALSAGMPSSYDYLTYANHTASGPDEGDYELFTVPDTFLVNGTNVIAVEVHQTNAGSSDLGFDLELEGKKGRLVTGKIFLDMDGTGTETPLDVFGSGAIEIRMYNDADSNNILLETEVVKSILTNPYGDYKTFVDPEVKHLVVKMMTEDFDAQVEYTTDTILSFALDTSNTDTVFADFGTLGPRSLCLLIADDQMNDDKYYMSNRITGKNQYISTMATDEIEALAIRIGMDSMWAFDDGQFGTVDISTGEFTDVGSGLGTASGYIGGSLTTHTMTDLDGLAYDGNSDILYAVEKRVGSNDLLVAVNRLNGTFITDFFGTDSSFVEITGTGIKTDVDDIAFNPTDGQLLAVNNIGNGDSTRYISINPENGIGTVLSIIGVGDFEGLGYYNTGELYGTTGVEVKDGYPINSVYKIDKATGVGTKLDSLYSGAIDVEACDCLTGPVDNLISGTVFYDADSSGTYNSSIDSAYGNVKIYLYTDINNNGVIESTDLLVDSILSDPNTGLYVFIVDSIGDFLTTPYIEFTALATMNTTTDDSLTEAANFEMLGDFDGRNDFGFNITAGSPYLPVDWLDIAAEWTENNHAAITWSTASELNASHYEVERKTDDGSFEYAGRVEAAGNSQKITNYSFVDFEAKTLETKNIFYRVKQIDFDYAYTFSDIVALSKKASLSVTAYPNPVADFVNVTISKQGDYTISLTDMAGNLIIENTGVNDISMAPIRITGLNQLRRGMYILRVTCNGEDQIVKLLK